MEFLSTLSLRRATSTTIITICIALFLSTLSLRRATSPSTFFYIILQNFYPRSPCGERRAAYSGNGARPHISIHALLAESDCDLSIFPPPQVISIHALLAESDDNTHTYRVYCPAFLSTLSLRRATRSEQPSSGLNIHFYPRSPCGERPVKGKSASPVIGISIHALLAESDYIIARAGNNTIYFYPRSPCGERHARRF